MDVLITKKQSILYNIFEWPTHNNSMLLVIGITNTLHLAEQLLPKISSRLGIEKLVFKERVIVK